jgi:hypothetical protein
MAGVASGRVRNTPRWLALGVFASLVAGCGAGDAEPPRVVSPPTICEPIDVYLQDLRAAAESGQLDGLATVLRERVPEDVRRDFVDGLLRLLRAFERGAISSLASGVEDVDDRTEGGVQAALGDVVHWLVEPAPRTDLFLLLQRILATCEGGPALGLLAEIAADGPFIDALLRLLIDPALIETLADLSFEGTNGREALQYLVRNLLLSATSTAFRVETITDLVALFVDLEVAPWNALRDGLVRALDADGLPVAQELLACIGRVDPELVLGATLHDLLTSNVLAGLADIIPATPPARGEADPLRNVVQQLLQFLADDALTRRSLASTLVFILNPADAPPALASAAVLLDAGALDGVFALVLDLVTGACRR